MLFGIEGLDAREWGGGGGVGIEEGEEEGERVGGKGGVDELNTEGTLF